MLPAMQVGDPLAFYSVVATLIPVLFIGLALEVKFFKVAKPERWTDLVAGLVVNLPGSDRGGRGAEGPRKSSAV